MRERAGMFPDTHNAMRRPLRVAHRGRVRVLRRLCLLQAVELDDLVRHIAGEVRLDVVVEPLGVLLPALPDLSDGEPAAGSLVGHVEHEARLRLELLNQRRRNLVVERRGHPLDAVPNQYRHGAPSVGVKTTMADNRDQLRRWPLVRQATCATRAITAGCPSVRECFL